MSEIRKYSKEWFVNNKSNPDSIKNMEKGAKFNIKYFQEGEISKSIFEGSLEDVQNKVEKLRNKKTRETYTQRDIIIKYGGVENLYKLMDENGDGKVTPEEIALHKYSHSEREYAKGDIDMVLFEMAMKDSRTKAITKNSKSNYIYIEKASLEDPLNWGEIGEAVYYLTGRKATYGKTEKDITNILSRKLKKPDNYAVIARFKEKDEKVDKTIIKNHFYSVKKVTENTIYIVNPWDSSKEIAYPKKDFLNNCLITTSTYIKT